MIQLPPSNGAGSGGAAGGGSGASSPAGNVAAAPINHQLPLFPGGNRPGGGPPSSRSAAGPIL